MKEGIPKKGSQPRYRFGSVHVSRVYAGIAITLVILLLICGAAMATTGTIRNVSGNGTDGAGNQTNGTVPTGNITTTATTVAPTTTPDDTPVIRSGTNSGPQYTLRLNSTVTGAERKAAADEYRPQWDQFLLGRGEVGITALDPGGVPHYMGPYANYANSPMPKGNVTSLTLVSGGSGYSVNTTIDIVDVYETGSGAAATPIITGGVITGITLVSNGTGYTAPHVIITDDTGADALITASITPDTASGIRKFMDVLPGLNSTNANLLGQYIPVAIPDKTRYPAGGAGYTSPPVVTILDTKGTGANATATVAGGKVTAVNVVQGGSGYSDHPVVAFTGGNPTVGAVAIPTVSNGVITAITVTGCDYYEIELGEYNEQMHRDLPNTTLRGYRQTNAPDSSVNTFHQLGPVIVTERDRPVRVKFVNKLPTGAGGNLSIPVDFTVMGAGMGPLGMNTTPGYPVYYTENRAAVHLHGGVTPWISDGTPYQWNTPAGQATDYPQGASVYNVPDMPDAGPNPPQGVMTFYYTNQQSARLMFYHDHAHGITRLNVYTGQAGGYLVRDQVEKDMIDGTNVTGINPTGAKVIPDREIPLIIQDKTFVDADTIASQDPTWNWGTTPGVPTTGDLWYPHVYMPAQNPYTLDGVNPFGRWAYGPWFWPPTNTLYGPVANPYYDPVNASWEPPMIPGTPNPSTCAEAFMDTPTVNGAVYPYLDVQPKAYRFRILNAADDRFLNLQLYEANTTIVTADGRHETEVTMVPAVPTPGFPVGWPTDGRAGGAPDPATRGPSFIQIGTEGGFLPAPVVVPNQPITWVTDPTVFNAGNVDLHALLIAPAERADVIIDFSQYAGKTLILYNDAPAAFPARDARYDYYTGSPDLTDIGGAPPVQPGYGPNTRTIMQIHVAGSPVDPVYDMTKLQGVFAKTAGKRGVFEVSQEDILIPNANYNTAYNANFPADTYVRIFQTSTTFRTLAGDTVTMPLTSKAIQDEQGEAYDEYGRLSSLIGLQVPGPTGQQNLLLYSYSSPPIDLLQDTVYGSKIGTLGDGTQIWKITHNGVDTHPVHWHLFNIQVINRVGWDGIIRPPDANELGWKETLRVNPLEDTIVAMRPYAPIVPFDLPNSIRPIEPAEPLGVLLKGAPGGLGFFDPSGEPVNVFNHVVNYGWEYVFHCHILAHEEMDMMHSMIFAKSPLAPSNLTARNVGTGTAPKVNLTWRDNSLSETNFTIQRATNPAGPWTNTTIISDTGPVKDVFVTFTDTSVVPSTTYYYRVFGVNLVGDTAVYPAPSIGFPTMAMNSTLSDTVNITTSIPPPTFGSITPTSGLRGTTVTFTITGTNYEPGLTTVTFRTPTGALLNPATLTSVTSTQIRGRIVIPANAWVGAYTVTITTVDGGSVSRTGAFTVTSPTPPPTITGVTPTTATRNTVWSYTVTGTNFVSGQTTVTLTRAGSANIATTVTSTSATQIRGNIRIPATATPGLWNVLVNTPGGSATRANAVRIR